MRGAATNTNDDSSLVAESSRLPCSLPSSIWIQIGQFLPAKDRLRVARCSQSILQAINPHDSSHFFKSDLLSSREVHVAETSRFGNAAPAKAGSFHEMGVRTSQVTECKQSMAQTFETLPKVQEKEDTHNDTASTAPSRGEAHASAPADSSLDSSFWTMFALLSLVLVLAESSRGVVIPTLALYEQSLGGNTTFLAVLVAVFSVGRLGSSYVFGRYLTSCHKRSAASSNPTYFINQSIVSGLLLSLCVVVIGHVLYILAVVGGLSLLVFARLLVGFGTGTLVLARTFVGDRVPANKKSRYMAWLGVEQFVGFAFTPGLGSISFDTKVGPLHITKFNFGSYLLSILTVITGVGLCFVKHCMRNREQRTQRRLLQIQDLHSMTIDGPSEISIDSVSSEADSATAHQDDEEDSLPSNPRPVSTTNMLREPLLQGEQDSSSSLAPVVPVQPAAAAAAPPIRPPGSMSRDTLELWVLVFGNLVVRGSLSIAETFGSLIYFIVITPGDSDQTEDSAQFFFLLGVGGVAVFLVVEYLIKWISARWSLIVGVSAAILGYALMMDWDADLLGPSFVAGMVFVWSISSPISQTTIASQLSTELAARHKAAVARGAPAPSQALWMGHLTAAGSVGRIIFPLIGGLLYSPGNTGGVMLLCVLAHIVFAVGYVWLYRQQLMQDVRLFLADIMECVKLHDVAFRLRRVQLTQEMLQPSY